MPGPPPVQRDSPPFQARPAKYNQPAKHNQPAKPVHPLGPLIRRVRPPQVLRARLTAAAVAGACVGLLGLALWLKPDRRGVGTHEQLGLPPCSMIQVAGIPCPTCGMTTAFAYAARGRCLAALHTQPFGFFLAGTTLLLAVGALVALFTGQRWQINWYRLSPNRLILGVLVLFALAWLYKIFDHLAHAG